MNRSQHMRLSNPVYAGNLRLPLGQKALTSSSPAATPESVPYHPVPLGVGRWHFADVHGRDHGPYPHRKIARRVARERLWRDAGARAGFGTRLRKGVAA